MMIQKQMEMQAKQQKDHPAAPQEQTAPPAATGKQYLNTKKLSTGSAFNMLNRFFIASQFKGEKADDMLSTQAFL